MYSLIDEAIDAEGGDHTAAGFDRLTQPCREQLLKSTLTAQCTHEDQSREPGKVCLSQIVASWDLYAQMQWLRLKWTKRTSPPAGVPRFFLWAFVSVLLFL